MNNIVESKLKMIREKRNLSRKELAEQCEISFRTIQDYEQGHKDLSSARAETLFKMSQILNCTMEALLGIDDFEISSEYTARLDDKDIVIQPHDEYEIEKQKYRLLAYYMQSIEKDIDVFLNMIIVSPEYKMNGHWTIKSGRCYVEYLYKGKSVLLPFNLSFTEGMLPWLKEVAGLKIDYDIRCRKYNEQEMIRGGDVWDES